MKKMPFLAAVLLTVPILSAQTIDTKKAQNKALARRAAEADCYRKLAERIKGLKINAQTLVRDFVTESDVIETEVNTFLKGIKLGSPRYFDDGSCEVRGEVKYQKVVATLKKIHSLHYKGDQIKQSDFEKMSIRKDITVITAVGMGAPRPDPPIEQTEGTVTQPASSAPTPSIPDLWRRMGPQARLMARRAAELDAYRKLAERLRGFKINAQTYVRDFVTQSDEIATELFTTLRGVRAVREYYHSDEPICEVTVEIPWQRVLATIRESYTRKVKGDKVKQWEFKEISKRVEKKYYRATGMGIPPERLIKKVQPTMKLATPDWYSQPIRAVGEAPIMTDKPKAQARLMATRAAELDAKRKLAEMIDGFKIQAETSVRDFVTQHDEIRTELQSIIAGAYVKNVETTEDSIRVTVEIRGPEVWKVIADEMRIAMRR